MLCWEYKVNRQGLCPHGAYIQVVFFSVNKKRWLSILELQEQCTSPSSATVVSAVPFLTANAVGREQRLSRHTDQALLP